jgi:flagellar hook-basal body complex protein FliE
MSDLGVNGVLAQIRALHGQIGAAAGAAPGAAAATGATAATAANRPGFADALTRVADKVSQTQAHASRLAEGFERGDRDASLVQVMMAMQKAQVSFKAMTEVRNRLVQAYQDIQNMPI